MIELTVGLPMFRCKHIGWLALESLCRQQNINFEWELIVIEETSESYEPFGKEEVLKYKERLEKIGCKRIEYIPLGKWIPLSRKWKILGQNSSESSKIFVIHAADCFSYNTRLIESFDLIVNKDYDFISSLIGPFYDILTEKAMLFDMTKKLRIGGLNMSIKPYFIRNLPDETKRKGIDSWIINNMQKLKSNYRTCHIFTPNCVYGVDTQGLNNISIKRRRLMDTRKDIYTKPVDIRKHIPEDILNKLKECKKFSR